MKRVPTQSFSKELGRKAELFVRVFNENCVPDHPTHFH
jgi:hypothetical protein